MPISFLTTALLIVSVITNLTVEGIKKLLDGTKVKYSSNVLKSSAGAEVARVVKTFDSDGKLINTVVTYS